VVACGADDDVADDASVADVLVGNVVIRSVADLARLDGVARIDGELTLSGDLPENLVLPDLESIRDNLRLEAGGPRTLTLPALEEAGGIIGLSEGRALQRLDLPALHTLAGTWRNAVTSESSFLLPSVDVSAPNLRVVEGTLYGSQGDSLVFPRLERVGEISLHGSPGRMDLPALQSLDLLLIERVGESPTFTISLPSLRDLGDALVEGRSVVELSLPALERVRGLLNVQGPTLGVLRLPSLRVASELRLCSGEVVDLPVLQRVNGLSTMCAPAKKRVLSLPALQSVGDLDVGHGSRGELRLPALERAGSIALTGSDVTGLALPALTTLGSLTLVDNLALRSVSAPALEVLGSVFARNSEGSLCSLDQLSTKLRAPAEVVFEAESCR
jgi:hypothetical protein